MIVLTHGAPNMASTNQCSWNGKAKLWIKLIKK